MFLRNLRASALIHQETGAGQEPLHCLKSRRMPGWQRRYSGKPPQRNERTQDIGKAVLYNALPLLIYGDAADYEIPAVIPYLSLFFAGWGGIIQKRRFHPSCHTGIIPPEAAPVREGTGFPAKTFCLPTVNPFGEQPTDRIPPTRGNKEQQVQNFVFLRKRVRPGESEKSARRHG